MGWPAIYLYFWICVFVYLCIFIWNLHCPNYDGDHGGLGLVWTWSKCWPGIYLYFWICVFVYFFMKSALSKLWWDGFGQGANGGLRHMRAWQNGSFLGMCAISRNTQPGTSSGSGQISNICQCLIELSREGGWNKSIRASTERATVRAASRYGVVGQGLTEGHLTGHKSHMAQNKMIHNATWIMCSHHLRVYREAHCTLQYDVCTLCSDTNYVVHKLHRN